MRFLLLIFLLLLCVPAWAPDLPSAIETEVIIYHGIQSLFSEPGEFKPAIENARLAEYFLFREPASGELSYEDALKVAAELRTRFGYRLSSPPFSGADFEKWQLARREREVNVWVFEGVAQEVRIHLEEAAQGIPIPLTAVEFNSSLASYRFPKSLEITARGPGPMRVTLNQRAGGMKRLGELFELMGTTPAGQKLLGKFLPMLARGEVTLGVLTPEILKEFMVRNPLAKYEPAALYRFTPETGKAAVLIDETAETGVLLEQLVHEIAHAVDEDNRDAIFRREQQLQLISKVWNEGAKRASVRSGRPVKEIKFIDLEAADRMRYLEASENLHRDHDHHHLLAESVAYGTQAQVRREFVKKFPQAEGYYSAHLQRQDVAPNEVSLQAIVYFYGITEIHVPRAPCKDVNRAAGG